MLKVAFDTLHQTELASEEEYSMKKDTGKFRGNASEKSMILKTRLMAQKYAPVVYRLCCA